MEHARVAGLMAGHADVVGQLAAEALRVDDPGVQTDFGDLTLLHQLNVRSAWTVTVLAANRGLREGRIAVASVMTGDRLRAAAVAVDATRLDDAVEAVILVLISRRKIPARGLRVVGERRLEEILVAAQKWAVAVLSRADDPAHFMRTAEDFLAVRSGFHTRSRRVCRSRRGTSKW